MHELASASIACRRRTVALLSAAMLLFPLGCKTGPASAPGSSSQDDATLTQAVQAKLSSDTSLGNEPIQAAVQQGVATLNGTVSSDAARSLAASDAAQIAGIRTVVNDLVVQPSAAVGTGSMPPPLKSVKPTGMPREVERPGRPLKSPARPSAEDPALPPPVLAQAAAPPAPAPIERETPPAQAPPAPPPAIRSIELAAGTTLPVRITQTLDSATAQQGQTFSGIIASDVLSDNLVVLPQGTPVSGRVAAVQEAAHFKGNSLLTIELTSLDHKGDHIPLATDSFSKAGNGRGKNSAEKIGGGAAVGAILGGILGGGKGAAIGAAAGGGAGAGVQAVTRGKQVQIESETLVRFHLSNPIAVRVLVGNQSRGSQNDPDLQRHP